jgi:hypothetical protein
VNQTKGLQAARMGWMVGPYGTMRLSDQVFLEACGGYGRSSDSMTDALDPTATGPQGLRGAIKWGVSMKTPTGLTIAAQGSYDGIGANGYSAITASARVNVPLN